MGVAQNRLRSEDDGADARHPNARGEIFFETLTTALTTKLPLLPDPTLSSLHLPLQMMTAHLESMLMDKLHSTNSAVTPTHPIYLGAYWLAAAAMRCMRARISSCACFFCLA